jgi:hypothetical protein
LFRPFFKEFHRPLHIFFDPLAKLIGVAEQGQSADAALRDGLFEQAQASFDILVNPIASKISTAQKGTA